MFYMDETGISHKREVYNLIEALSDIGGIIEVIFVLFGTIFLPLSRHSFYLHAARFMFFARSRDPSLFVKGNKHDEKVENLAKYMNQEAEEQAPVDNRSIRIQQELRKHHIIRISNCNNVKLFFASFVPECCWEKKQKFKKLLEESERKIDKQADIVRIMHNLLKLKILLKNSLMSQEIEHKMHHSEKFLIDLDDMDSESSESSEDEPIDQSKNGNHQNSITLKMGERSTY
jgi:hypothetical protein